MRSRRHATIVAAFSLLLPPFSFVGGGIVGLATLRHGFVEGALVAAGSLALAGVAAYFLLNTLGPVLIFAVVTALPVLILATVLRFTKSLAAAVTVAGVLGCLVVAGFHALVDDPAVWWRDVLMGVLTQSVTGGAGVADADAAARIEDIVDVLAPLMRALPAGAMFGAILTLLLARWWHAILDNPGGFAREFRNLRLDPRVAAGAAVVAIAAILTDGAAGGIGVELFGIVVILFMFQGLGLTHALVALRNTPRAWLVTLYVFFFLTPGIVTDVLAIVGFLDVGLDFRRRAGIASGS